MSVESELSEDDISKFFILTTAFEPYVNRMPSQIDYIGRNDIPPEMRYKLYVRAVLYYELSPELSLGAYLFRRNALSIHVWNAETDHSAALK